MQRYIYYYYYTNHIFFKTSPHKFSKHYLPLLTSPPWMVYFSQRFAGS